MDPLHCTTDSSTSSSTTWAAFGTKRAPCLYHRWGGAPLHRDRPVSAPCLDKESEQGEERKLLPESEPQANLSRLQQIISLARSLGGTHTLSDVRGVGTEGGGIWTVAPKLTNPRPKRHHHHHHRLSRFSSLCQPSLFSSRSLALSHTPAPPCFRQGALHMTIVVGVGHTG